MIINRNLLLAFERVAQLGTVHAAARDLRLTQTAITQRLKSLEKELGLSLFLRSRRGMALTEEGRLLLRYQDALKEVDAQFIPALQGGQRDDVQLTLLGPTSAIATRLADACLSLYGKHPFLRLHLRSEDEANRIDQVKSGLADLAVVPPQLVPFEMESKVLKPDRYLLVACAAWRGRRLSTILAEERAIDFNAKDETTLNYLKHFGLVDGALRARLFVNQNEALVRYFAAGVGYGTLTESVAKPWLQKGELVTLNRGQALEEALALVWYRRSRKLAYFDELIKAL